MSENGGEITPGERLRRIEEELKSINEHLNDRISRHRDKNQEHIRQLADSIVRDFGDRLQTLERHDVAEDAVHSYRKWLIGVGVIGLGGLLINLVMLLQLLSRTP